jgi:hypothetical protein
MLAVRSFLMMEPALAPCVSSILARAPRSNEHAFCRNFASATSTICPSTDNERIVGESLVLECIRDNHWFTIINHVGTKCGVARCLFHV